MPGYSQEEMRAYMAVYRDERRAFARNRLGGRCVVCGSTDNLQFDHIDPDSKADSIGNMWHAKWADFVAELDKCQLLCVEHHKQRHKGEEHGRNAYSHGRCRCDICKAANAAYSREQRARRGGLSARSLGPENRHR